MENFPWCTSFRKFCTGTLALVSLSFPRKRNPRPSLVIPAKAGIQRGILCHSPESGNPASAFSVIPAKAGIQHFEVFAAPRGYCFRRYDANVVDTCFRRYDANVVSLADRYEKCP
jgi:hypothetical protein